MKLSKSTRNKITAFYWTTLNGIIAILIAYLTDINYQYLVLIVPILNLLTKELNRYFNPNFK